MTDRKMDKIMDKVRRLEQEFDAVDLHDQSDALLKRCGWELDTDGFWHDPDGDWGDNDERPHPYADAQQAIDLAEAMSFDVRAVAAMDIEPNGYRALIYDTQGRAREGIGPTIAEAICDAIEEAVK